MTKKTTIRNQIYEILHKKGFGWIEIRKSGLQKLLKQLSKESNNQPEMIKQPKPELKKNFNNRSDSIRVWRASEDEKLTKGNS